MTKRLMGAPDDVDILARLEGWASGKSVPPLPTAKELKRFIENAFRHYRVTLKRSERAKQQVYTELAIYNREGKQVFALAPRQSRRAVFAWLVENLG